MYKLIQKIDESREICKNSQNSIEIRITELKSLKKVVNSAIRQTNEQKITNVPKKTTIMLIHTIANPNESEFLAIYSEIMAYASKAIILFSKKIAAENTEFLNEIQTSVFIADNRPESNDCPEVKPIEVSGTLTVKTVRKIDELTEVKIQFPGFTPDEPAEQNTAIFDGDTIPDFLIKAENFSDAAYAVEGPDERRIFVSEKKFTERRIFDFLDECAGKCEPIHEIIEGRCRFYCDLDDKIASLSRKHFVGKINVILHYFQKFFFDFYKPAYGSALREEDLKTIFQIAQSDNPAYNSAHIYIDVYNRETRKYYLTACPQHQLAFWRNFNRFLEKIPYFGRCQIIDFAVYKKNAQFRLAGTRKGGFLLKPFLIGECRRESFAANSMDDNVEILDAIKEEPIIYYNTEYDKILFERILQKSKLVIPPLGRKDTNGSGKDNIFRSAVYRIYCFYRMADGYNKITGSAVINNIRNFLKFKGFNSEQDLYFASKLVRGWEKNSKRCNFSMNSHKKFFEYQPAKPIRIETDRLTYGDFEGIVCIKSGTGTGKTYGFIEKYKNKNCLFISCKISLADEFKRTAEKIGVSMVHYGEVLPAEIIKKYNETGDVPKHFCVQLNSLYHYAEIIEKYDHIFVDESEALFGCFSHLLETVPKAMPALKAAFYEIMKKNVVFCSANLGERTFAFIEDYGRPYIFIENIKRDKEGYTAVECTDRGFYEQLGKAIRDNKKVAIPVNSKKIATKIALFIEQVDSTKKILIQTSLDKKEDISEWLKYDFLIYTSTIETGVSFTQVHFDFIMGYFKSGINTYDSCYQMLFRVRFPKTKKIFIYMQHGHSLKTADRMDEKRAAHHVDFQKRAELSSENKLDTFNEFIYKKSSDPVDRVLIRNIFVQNQSKTYFRKLLRTELENAGIKFEAKIFDCELKTVVEGVNEIHNLKLLLSQNMEFYLSVMGIEAEKFKMPEIDPKTSIETLAKKAYSRYKLENNYKLDFQETAFRILRKIVPDGGSIGDNDLDKALVEIFDKNYESMAACFGKRKYTKAEMMKRKLQYKVQFINGILGVAGYKFEKVENGYSIFEDRAVNEIFDQARKQKK